MANLLDLVNKIRDSFSDNQGWFRGGKFTPGQQIKDVQASSPVKSFGPFVVPNMKNQQTNQFYNQLSTPQGQAKFNETPVTNPLQGVVSYAANRYIAPIRQVPYNLQQVIGKNKSLGERGMGLLNLAGGTVAMIPDPIGDVAMPIYDYWKGVKVAQQKGEGTLQSYKTGLTALTGQKPVGLGEAVTKNETAKNILNIAELPLIIGATGKVNSIQKARKLVLDEAANIISSVNAAKHYYAYEPVLQREIVTNLEDLGKKLIPKIVNSKEMKELSLTDPQQWRNLVSEYLQDRLMAARNPELNVGFNTRNLKRIPEEELAKGVGGEGIKTPSQILTKIDQGTNGLPGAELNQQELDILGKYLKTNADTSLRGKITEGPNGTRDVIFGTIKDRRFKGQTEYLLMADSGPYKGAFRLSSTPIDSKFFGTKIVGEVGGEGVKPSGIKVETKSTKGVGGEGVNVSNLTTKVLRNEDVVRSLMNGQVFKMQLENGRVVAFGDKATLGRLGRSLGDDVTDVIPAKVGRGKSGEAGSGQPRLILDSQDDLIRLKDALRGKEKSAFTWDHIPSGAKISEDGKSFYYKEKSYPVPENLSPSKGVGEEGVIKESALQLFKEKYGDFRIVDDQVLSEKVGKPAKKIEIFDKETGEWIVGPQRAGNNAEEELNKVVDDWLNNRQETNRVDSPTWLDAAKRQLDTNYGQQANISEAKQATMKTQFNKEQYARRRYLENPTEENAIKWKETREGVYEVPINKLKLNQTKEETFSVAGGSQRTRTPDKPLVVLVNKDGQLVLQDGYHRYYDALDEGRKTVKVVFETPDDTNISKFIDDSVSPSKGVGEEISKTRAVGNNLSPPQETVPLGQQSLLPETSTNIKIKQTPLQTEVPPTVGGGPKTSQPNVPLPDSTITPVQKIINALKEAAPLNKEQQKIYAKIRSEQAGKIAGMQEGLGGEAGFHAELGALKGEMPKVQFEALKKSVGQADIDSLFNQIKSSNLTPFEKISAQSEFEKLLNGSVPTKSGLRLLNEVFPPEFVQTVLEKRSLFQKLTSGAENIINIPRSVMATGDLSAPLRQGIFLIGRPKQWIPAFKEMFKYAFNKNAYDGYDAVIKADPNYRLMREAKLAITDMGSDLLGREEAFMSNLPERIPGIGKIAAGSNRAYTGFLNKLRVDTFNDLISKAKAQGVELNEETLKNIGGFVNNATGRGEFRGIMKPFNKSGELLNAALFSPRLMASRLNLLDPTYYAKLDPFTRKEAVKSLFTFAGTVGSVLGLAKLAGADVGTDPRSADFGKIKVGNTRYDIAGGFSQYLRLGAQLITGKLISSTTGKEFILGDQNTYNPITRKDILLRFFESKEAPALSFMTALMTGKDAIGNAFDLPVQVINRLTPMIAQDAYDLWKERGAEGLIMALPGMFGVGSQTYGKQIPNLETTPSGNPTIKLKPVPGLSEDIVSKVTGKQYSNIPLDQQQPLAIKIQAEKQAKVDADKLKKQLESGKVDSATESQVQSAPDLKTAKLFFEYSDAKSTKVGDTYLYKNDKGDIKTLDLTLIEPPTLTGDYNLDKSLKSKYNSAISTQVSGIVDLYNMGELSQEEATKMVNTLTNQKITAPKKAKKISIAKVSVPKVSYKIRATPKRKLVGAKIAKRPNLKPVKTGNIKVAQIKVPEGNIKIAKPKTIRLT